MKKDPLLAQEFRSNAPRHQHGTPHGPAAGGVNTLGQTVGWTVILDAHAAMPREQRLVFRNGPSGFFIAKNRG